jgi:hypothetical protein
MRDYEGGKRASNGRPLIHTPIIQETTMIITNAKLNALDALFFIAEQIERIDPVAIGEKVINISATAAAIIIGVTSYVITALQLFWLEHNETIITNAVRFTFFIADTIGAVYYAGVNSRPVITHWAARLIDRVYFTAIAL